MTNSSKTPTKIRGVLIDLSGTLHIGNQEIPGANHAIARLREAVSKAANEQQSVPLAIRFLTNTSTKSIANLLQTLNDGSLLGFDIREDELITSLKATAQYVSDNDLNPLLLLEDASDFEGSSRPYDSVVVGLAPSKFCYEHLDEAFRILLEHPENLIAVHRGNFVRESNPDRLRLGPGAIVKALETASGCSPCKVMGKPNPEIFQAAIRSMNRDPNGVSVSGIQAKDDVCMIGDDIVVDCQGALNAGIGTAILVQTGKYRTGDEEKCTKESPSLDNLEQTGTFLVRPSIVEAIEYVIEVLERDLSIDAT